ncbi:MAG: hypothetical protein SPI28_00800 [Acetatifactor sp.]|nr:hypothetical protein [Acetatifactor sp.]
MRRYDEQRQELLEVVCNQCGRALNVVDGCLKEGCFHVDYPFGYFSRKDGMIHRFDLCEDCYDRMIGAFRLPISETENHELL